jgi:hypothetical protein
MQHTPYIVYAEAGFAQDWHHVRKQVMWSPNWEDAATFPTLEIAHRIALDVRGCVLQLIGFNQPPRLLTMADRQPNAVAA